MELGVITLSDLQPDPAMGRSGMLGRCTETLSPDEGL